jgi:hypothetical protein
LGSPYPLRIWPDIDFSHERRLLMSNAIGDNYVAISMISFRLPRGRAATDVITRASFEHYLRKRKLTNKTAITKAAAMAVVPWAFIESPQRLSSSLSMAQLSLKIQSCGSGGRDMCQMICPTVKRKVSGSKCLYSLVYSCIIQVLRISTESQRQIEHCEPECSQNFLVAWNAMRSTIKRSIRTRPFDILIVELAHRWRAHQTIKR